MVTVINTKTFQDDQTRNLPSIYRNRIQQPGKTFYMEKMNFTLNGNWHTNDWSNINPFSQTRDQEPRRKKAKVEYKLEGTGRKRKPKPEPKFTFTPTTEHREKMVENSAKAKIVYIEGIEREYNLLLDIARAAKENIGEYRQYLYGTNHKCQARRRAWEQFIKECARQRGARVRENTLRRAIRVVMDGTGERWMMPDQHTTRGWIREVWK